MLMVKQCIGCGVDHVCIKSLAKDTLYCCDYCEKSHSLLNKNDNITSSEKE
ncbi:hypothetical protein [Viridibacillus arvi]|uniref:hypothetical protein n=1 Tax=Viridibacillus arvi TaxID=263475 RepID=UPI003D2A8E12